VSAQYHVILDDAVVANKAKRAKEVVVASFQVEMMEWDRTTLVAPQIYIGQDASGFDPCGPLKFGWCRRKSHWPSAISPDNTTLPPSAERGSRSETAGSVLLIVDGWGILRRKRRVLLTISFKQRPIVAADLRSDSNRSHVVRRSSRM